MINLSRINRRKLVTAIGVVVIVICLMSTSKNVYAQNTALGIYPPVTTITISQARQVEIPFQITNGSAPVQVITSIMPIASSDAYGGVKIVDCTRDEVGFCQNRIWFSGLKEQVTRTKTETVIVESIEKNGLFLAGNKTGSYSLSLTIPPDTPAGDYPFVLLLTTNNPLAGNKSAIHHRLTIGSLILITVAPDGKVDRKGQIITFSPTGGIPISLLSIHTMLFDSFDLIPFVTQVANIGKSHLEAEGEIAISGIMSPSITHKIPSTYILSNSIKTLKSTAKDIVTNLPEADLNTYSLIFPKSIYLGKYNVTGSIQLSAVTPAIGVQTSFIAVPYKIIGILFFIIIVVKTSMHLYKRGRKTL